MLKHKPTEHVTAAGSRLDGKTSATQWRFSKKDGGQHGNISLGTITSLLSLPRARNCIGGDTGSIPNCSAT